jgi:hypothetical protein
VKEGGGGRDFVWNNDCKAAEDGRGDVMNERETVC